MLKDKEIYNYWNGDIYEETKDLESKSNIVSFVRKGEKLTLDVIYDNLDKLNKEFIVDLKKEDDKIIVKAKENDVETEIELVINKNNALVAGDLLNVIKIPGANHGVGADVLKESLENPSALVAVAKFDLQKPFVSYYSQYKVLAKAVKYSLIFDMSARKVFSKEYEDYMDKVDSDLLVNNVYTVLAGKNGWCTTLGLSRFHLKELEMNKSVNNQVAIKFFRKINSNRLIRGELKHDILINYGGEEYFTIMSLEDLKANFSDKYITKGVYNNIEETSKYREVLVPFSKEKININNLEKDADFTGFTKEEINFEIPEFLRNKVRLARQTLPFLFDFLSASNKFMLLIEFELTTANKKEYVYASVESLKENGFTGYLMTDSLHNDELKKGSKITGSLDKMLNWEVRLNPRQRVNPINAYAFKIMAPNLKK